MAHYSSLQVFGYGAAAVWMAGNLILGSRAAYLSFKMENCRLPNQAAPRGRKFAFQKEARDFSEVGQMYRCKAIKTELVLFAWCFGVVCLIGIITGGR